MESVAVNWEALDALLIDFAKSENLLDDPSPSPPASAAYRSRLLIRRIRRSLDSGDLDLVFHLLRHHAPAVLDDHRILFRLLKQVSPRSLFFLLLLLLSPHSSLFFFLLYLQFCLDLLCCQKIF